MEYESSEAKRLVEMLETSEAQEKEYLLRRTKKLAIIWSLVFLFVVIGAALIIWGFSERSRYVDFDLHYVKYFYDSTDPDAGRLVVDEKEERKAAIYDSIGNILPPENVEGFNFTEKYYNSSNYEVEVDSSSNIAQSLTYENAIYMQYTLGHYQLTLQTSATDLENRYSTPTEAIGYNKVLYIAPESPFDNDDFYNRYLQYKKGGVSTYVRNNFINLYSLQNCTIDEAAGAGNRVVDFDGMENKHIVGFRYYHNNVEISYTVTQVYAKLPDDSTVSTYLVTKKEGDKTYSNLSNGYNIEYMIDEEGNITSMPRTEMINGVPHYIATTKVENDSENANVFFMPGKDTIVTIEWEVDDRSMIVMDTIDEYTWDNYVFADYSTFASIEERYNLIYNTVHVNVENAAKDGVSNDWDYLEEIFSQYSDPDWQRGVVTYETTFVDTNINTYLNSKYFKEYIVGEDTDLENHIDDTSTYYYPLAKAGYKFAGWQIWIKNTNDPMTGTWVDVNNTTNIEDRESTCIMIRAKWTPEEYALKFSTDTIDGGVVTISAPLNYENKGYTRPKGKYQLNNSVDGVDYVDKDGLVVWTEPRLVKGVETSDSRHIYVSRLGYNFIGWQLQDGEVMYYNTSAGGKTANGYTNIGSTNEGERHVIVQSPTFQFAGSSGDVFITKSQFEQYSYNDNISSSDRLLWKCESNGYIFYYFGTYADLSANKTSDMTIPKGYYSALASDIQLYSFWDLIESQISLEYNIDDAEIIVDETNNILGLGNVYGLKDSYSMFNKETTSIYLDNWNTEKKGSDELHITFDYDVTKTLYLPNKSQIYRRGYVLVGWKLIKGNTSQTIDLANSSNPNANVVINYSSNSSNSLLMDIGDIYGAVTAEPIWQANAYVVNGTDVANRYKVINAGDADAEPYVDILNKDSVYGEDETTSTVIKLEDFYSQSAFDVRVQFAGGYYVDITAEDMSASLFGEDRDTYTVAISEGYITTTNTNGEPIIYASPYYIAALGQNQLPLTTISVSYNADQDCYIISFDNLTVDVTNIIISNLSYNLVSNTFQTRQEGTSDLQYISESTFVPSKWYLIGGNDVEKANLINAISLYNSTATTKIRYILQQSATRGEYIVRDMLNYTDSEFAKVMTINLNAKASQNTNYSTIYDRWLLSKDINSVATKPQMVYGDSTDTYYTTKNSTTFTVTITVESAYEVVWQTVCPITIGDGVGLKSGDISYSTNEDSQYTIVFHPEELMLDVQFSQILSAEDDNGNTTRLDKDYITYSIVSDSKTVGLLNEKRQTSALHNYRGQQLAQIYTPAIDPSTTAPEGLSEFKNSHDAISVPYMSSILVEVKFSGKYEAFGQALAKHYADKTSNGYYHIERWSMLSNHFTYITFGAGNTTSIWFLDEGVEYERIFFQICLNDLTNDVSEGLVDIYFHETPTEGESMPASKYDITIDNIAGNNYQLIDSGSSTTANKKKAVANWGNIIKTGKSYASSAAMPSESTLWDKDVTFGTTLTFTITINDAFDNSGNKIYPRLKLTTSKDSTGKTLMVNGKAGDNIYTFGEMTLTYTMTNNTTYVLRLESLDCDVNITPCNIYRKVNTLCITDQDGTDITTDIISGTAKYVDGTYMYTPEIGYVDNSNTFNKNVYQIGYSYDTGTNKDTFTINGSKRYEFQSVSAVTSIYDFMTRYFYTLYGSMSNLFNYPSAISLKIGDTTTHYATNGNLVLEIAKDNNVNAYSQNVAVQSSDITIAKDINYKPTSYTDTSLNGLNLIKERYNLSVSKNANATISAAPSVINLSGSIPTAGLVKNSGVWVVDYQTYWDALADNTTLCVDSNKFDSGNTYYYNSYIIFAVKPEVGWTDAGVTCEVVDLSNNSTYSESWDKNNTNIQYFHTMLKPETTNGEYQMSLNIALEKNGYDVSLSGILSGVNESDGVKVEAVDNAFNNGKIKVGHGDDQTITITLKAGYASSDIIITIKAADGTAVYNITRSGATITAESLNASISINAPNGTDILEQTAVITFTIPNITGAMSIDISNVKKDAVSYESTHNDDQISQSAMIYARDAINSSSLTTGEFTALSGSGFNYGDDIKLVYTPLTSYELSAVAFTINGRVFTFAAKTATSTNRESQSEDGLLQNNALVANNITITEENGVFNITITRVAQDISIRVSALSVNAYTIITDGKGAAKFNVNSEYTMEETTTEFTITAELADAYDPTKTSFTITIEDKIGTTHNISKAELAAAKEIEIGDQSMNISYTLSGKVFTFDFSALLGNITIEISPELSTYDVTFVENSTYFSGISYQVSTAAALTSYTNATASSGTVNVEHGAGVLISFTLNNNYKLKTTDAGLTFFELNGTSYDISAQTDSGLYGYAAEGYIYGFDTAKNVITILIYNVTQDTTKTIDITSAVSEHQYTVKVKADVNDVFKKDVNSYVDVDSTDVGYSEFIAGQTISFEINPKYSKMTIDKLTNTIKVSNVYGNNLAVSTTSDITLSISEGKLNITIPANTGYSVEISTDGWTADNYTLRFKLDESNYGYIYDTNNNLLSAYLKSNGINEAAYTIAISDMIRLELVTDNGVSYYSAAYGYSTNNISITYTVDLNRVGYTSDNEIFQIGTTQYAVTTLDVTNLDATIETLLMPREYDVTITKQSSFTTTSVTNNQTSFLHYGDSVTITYTMPNRFYNSSVESKEIGGESKTILATSLYNIYTVNGSTNTKINNMYFVEISDNDSANVTFMLVIDPLQSAYKIEFLDNSLTVDMFQYTVDYVANSTIYSYVNNNVDTAKNNATYSNNAVTFSGYLVEGGQKLALITVTISGQYVTELGSIILGESKITADTALFGNTIKVPYNSVITVSVQVLESATDGITGTVDSWGFADGVLNIATGYENYMSFSTNGDYIATFTYAAITADVTTKQFTLALTRNVYKVTLGDNMAISGIDVSTLTNVGEYSFNAENAGDIVYHIEDEDEDGTADKYYYSIKHGTNIAFTYSSVSNMDIAEKAKRKDNTRDNGDTLVADVVTLGISKVGALFSYYDGLYYYKGYDVDNSSPVGHSVTSGMTFQTQSLAMRYYNTITVGANMTVAVTFILDGEGELTIYNSYATGAGYTTYTSTDSFDYELSEGEYTFYFSFSGDIKALNIEYCKVVTAAYSAGVANGVSVKVDETKNALNKYSGSENSAHFSVSFDEEYADDVDIYYIDISTHIGFQTEFADAAINNYTATFTLSNLTLAGHVEIDEDTDGNYEFVFKLENGNYSMSNHHGKSSTVTFTRNNYYSKTQSFTIGQYTITYNPTSGNWEITYLYEGVVETLEEGKFKEGEVFATLILQDSIGLNIYKIEFVDNNIAITMELTGTITNSISIALTDIDTHSINISTQDDVFDKVNYYSTIQDVTSTGSYVRATSTADETITFYNDKALASLPTTGYIANLYHVFELHLTKDYWNAGLSGGLAKITYNSAAGYEISSYTYTDSSNPSHNYIVLVVHYLNIITNRLNAEIAIGDNTTTNANHIAKDSYNVSIGECLDETSGAVCVASTTINDATVALGGGSSITVGSGVTIVFTLGSEYYSLNGGATVTIGSVELTLSRDTTSAESLNNSVTFGDETISGISYEALFDDSDDNNYIIMVTISALYIELAVNLSVYDVDKYEYTIHYIGTGYEIANKEKIELPFNKSLALSSDGKIMNGTDQILNLGSPLAGLSYVGLGLITDIFGAGADVDSSYNISNILATMRNDLSAYKINMLSDSRTVGEGDDETTKTILDLSELDGTRHLFVIYSFTSIDVTIDYESDNLTESFAFAGDNYSYESSSSGTHTFTYNITQYAADSPFQYVSGYKVGGVTYPYSIDNGTLTISSTGGISEYITFWNALCATKTQGATDKLTAVFTEHGLDISITQESGSVIAMTDIHSLFNGTYTKEYVYISDSAYVVVDKIDTAGTYTGTPYACLYNSSTGTIIYLTNEIDENTNNTIWSFNKLVAGKNERSGNISEDKSAIVYTDFTGLTFAGKIKNGMKDSVEYNGTKYTTMLSILNDIWSSGANINKKSSAMQSIDGVIIIAPHAVITIDYVITLPSGEEITLQQVELDTKSDDVNVLSMYEAIYGNAELDQIIGQDEVDLVYATHIVGDADSEYYTNGYNGSSVKFTLEGFVKNGDEYVNTGAIASIFPKQWSDYLSEDGTTLKGLSLYNYLSTEKDGNNRPYIDDNGVCSITFRMIPTSGQRGSAAAPYVINNANAWDHIMPVAATEAEPEVINASRNIYITQVSNTVDDMIDLTKTQKLDYYFYGNVIGDTSIKSKYSTRRTIENAEGKAEVVTDNVGLYRNAKYAANTANSDINELVAFRNYVSGTNVAANETTTTADNVQISAGISTMIGTLTYSKSTIQYDYVSDYGSDVAAQTYPMIQYKYFPTVTRHVDQNTDISHEATFIYEEMYTILQLKDYRTNYLLDRNSKITIEGGVTYIHGSSGNKIAITSVTDGVDGITITEDSSIWNDVDGNAVTVYVVTGNEIKSHQAVECTKTYTSGNNSAVAILLGKTNTIGSIHTVYSGSVFGKLMQGSSVSGLNILGYINYGAVRATNQWADDLDANNVEQHVWGGLAIAVENGVEVSNIVNGDEYGRISTAYDSKQILATVSDGGITMVGGVIGVIDMAKPNLGTTDTYDYNLNYDTTSNTTFVNTADAASYNLADKEGNTLTVTAKVAGDTAIIDSSSASLRNYYHINLAGSVRAVLGGIIGGVINGGEKKTINIGEMYNAGYIHGTERCESAGIITAYESVTDSEYTATDISLNIENCVNNHGLLSPANKSSYVAGIYNSCSSATDENNNMIYHGAKVNITNSTNYKTISGTYAYGIGISKDAGAISKVFNLSSVRAIYDAVGMISVTSGTDDIEISNCITTVDDAASKGTTTLEGKWSVTVDSIRYDKEELNSYNIGGGDDVIGMFDITTDGDVSISDCTNDLDMAVIRSVPGDVSGITRIDAGGTVTMKNCSNNGRGAIETLTRSDGTYHPTIMGEISGIANIVNATDVTMTNCDNSGTLAANRGTIYGVANINASGNVDMTNCDNSGTIQDSVLLYTTDGTNAGNVYAGKSSLYVYGVAKIVTNGNAEIDTASNSGYISASSEVCGLFSIATSGDVTLDNCDNINGIATSDNIYGVAKIITTGDVTMTGCDSSNSSATADYKTYQGWNIYGVAYIEAQDVYMSECHNYNKIDNFNNTGIGYGVGHIKANGNLTLLDCSNSGAIQAVAVYGVAYIQAGKPVIEGDVVEYSTRIVRGCSNSGTLQSTGIYSNPMVVGVISMPEISGFVSVSDCHNTGNLTGYDAVGVAYITNLATDYVHFFNPIENLINSDKIDESGDIVAIGNITATNEATGVLYLDVNYETDEIKISNCEVNHDGPSNITITGKFVYGVACIFGAADVSLSNIVSYYEITADNYCGVVDISSSKNVTINNIVQNGSINVKESGFAVGLSQISAHNITIGEAAADGTAVAGSGVTNNATIVAPDSELYPLLQIELVGGLELHEAINNGDITHNYEIPPMVNISDKNSNAVNILINGVQDNGTHTNVNNDGMYGLVFFSNSGNYNKNITIKNCTNNCTLANTVQGSGSENAMIIGIAYLIDNFANANASVYMENCTNNAAITVATPADIDFVGIANIEGFGDVEISNCINYKELTTNSYDAGARNYNIARILEGKGDVTITGCVNNRSCSSMSNIEVGIAWIETTGNASVINCYNNGSTANSSGTNYGICYINAGGDADVSGCKLDCDTFGDVDYGSNSDSVTCYGIAHIVVTTGNVTLSNCSVTTTIGGNTIYTIAYVETTSTSTQMTVYNCSDNGTILVEGFSKTGTTKEVTVSG